MILDALDKIVYLICTFSASLVVQGMVKLYVLLHGYNMHQSLVARMRQGLWHVGYWTTFLLRTATSFFKKTRGASRRVFSWDSPYHGLPWSCFPNLRPLAFISFSLDWWNSLKSFSTMSLLQSRWIKRSDLMPNNWCYPCSNTHAFLSLSLMRWRLYLDSLIKSTLYSTVDFLSVWHLRILSPSDLSQREDKTFRWSFSETIPTGWSSSTISTLLVVLNQCSASPFKKKVAYQTFPPQDIA